MCGYIAAYAPVVALCGAGVRSVYVGLEIVHTQNFNERNYEQEYVQYHRNGGRGVARVFVHVPQLQGERYKAPRQKNAYYAREHHEYEARRLGVAVLDVLFFILVYRHFFV